MGKFSIKVIGGGVFLKNKPQTITITWEIKDEDGNKVIPDKLWVNNIIQDPATTSKTYNRVYSDVDFTVKAIKDDIVAIGITTARFLGPNQTVEDSLNSSSNSIALSANQGKVLNEKIDNASNKFKGLFTTLIDLKKKIRTGEEGDWAIVGESIPANIFRWGDEGWESTGGTYDGTVDLTPYTRETKTIEYTDDYNVSKNHTHVIKVYDVINWATVTYDPTAPVYKFGDSYDEGEVVNMIDDIAFSYKALSSTVTAPYLTQESNAYTLEDAITLLPEELATAGQKISFYNIKEESWMTYVFTGGDHKNATFWEVFTNNVDKDINNLQNQINEDKQNLEDHITEANNKFNSIDNKFTEVDKEIDNVDNRILLSSTSVACGGEDIELVADRAYKDSDGNVITDTYVTREGLTNSIIDITNQQVTDLKPGSVDPEDLSEATKQLLGNKFIVNLPDEEDITTKDQLLKLKDKEYSPKDYSGMGRKRLRKHYVNGVNVLTQHMINKPNTIYIIEYDYCLADQTIEVPDNCVLDFQGGSLRNGIVILNGTSLMEDGSRIFDNITLSGILNGDLSCTMFGASPSSSKDLNLDSIKETIKQLDNVGGGELLIPQEINYGYERNTPSTWVYTTVSNNIIVKDESKGNTYNLPSRDGSQIRNFFMTEGNPMDGKHDGGGFMVRANWHPYMMLSNDRDPVEANNRRATYFVGNNGKICWGIGQGSNTIEPDGTDRDDALSNFKIVGNDIAGGNGLTNMMVINKTNAFFGFNLSTPAQDYHFNFRNVEGRDNANVHFDASLRSGTLEILLTAGEAKKRIGVSPITNNLYFVSDNSIVTSITRNGDILLKGNLGLFTGEGDPNGVFSCGIGALYQNRTVRANGKGLYVCTDTANKKFNLVSGVDSCTSTSRPSTTELPVGFPTFDTTLGKPIWWTGTNWVDATGTTV